jgi:bla regulator protein blaR1
MSGQAAATTGGSFAVASIKPNKSGTGQVNFGSQPGGRITATNVSLVDAIRMAYGTAGPFPLNRVVGAAGWLASDRFDIVAKADGDPSLEQIQLMMRALLAERFKLAVHNETRERPIYALVVARSDGRLGPGLKRSDMDCSNPSPSSSCELKNLPGKLTATAIPMETLARTLVSWIDDHREIRDQTGLAGNFGVTLEWTPLQLAPRLPDGPGGVIVPPVDPNGASLFTALQEQLGLKLEPGKDQSDVLVIDHAEHPTEN